MFWYNHHHEITLIAHDAVIQFTHITNHAVCLSVLLLWMLAGRMILKMAQLRFKMTATRDISIFSFPVWLRLLHFSFINEFWGAEGYSHVWWPIFNLFNTLKTSWIPQSYSAQFCLTSCITWESRLTCSCSCTTHLQNMSPIKTKIG